MTVAHEEPLLLLLAYQKCELQVGGAKKGGVFMAPAYTKVSLCLLKALLFVPRVSYVATFPISRQVSSSRSPCCSGRRPWQHLLRNYSSGRGGDGEDGFDPFDKTKLGSSVSGGDGRGESRDNDDEDVRLFGEGGLFGPVGKTADDDRDEWEDREPPPSHESDWSAYNAKGGGEYGGDEQYDAASRGYYEAGTVGFDKPEGYAGGTAGEGIEGPQADQRGVWDGEEGEAVPKGAVFGELVEKTGYTEDDINNMILGFYEPATLPHLDDYKFVDKEAERKKKRREMELAKMAEMAKRWVKKVDEQGFAHGVGRRKTSSARVWIKEGEGKIIINKQYHDMYFSCMDNRVEYLEPFVVTHTMGMFDTFVLVRGGGVAGQASAIRHGLARALMWYDPSHRPILKSEGMLRRDDRIVERKKPGKAKARKSYQWVKR